MLGELGVRQLWMGLDGAALRELRLPQKPVLLVQRKAVREAELAWVLEDNVLREMTSASARTGSTVPAGGAGMSKQVSDQFAAIKHDISGIKEAVKELTEVRSLGAGRLQSSIEAAASVAASAAASLESLGVRVDDLESWALGLSGQATELSARLDALEELARAAQEGGAMMDSGGSHGDASSSAAARAEAARQQRDNALYEAVRNCMYAFMGITKGDKLPQPLKDGQYWLEKAQKVTSGAVVQQRLLRPDFDAAWGVNAVGWLLEVAAMMKQRVVSSEHTEYSLTRVTQRELTSAIETVFKSMVKKWNAQDQTEEKVKEKKYMDVLKKRKRNKSKYRQDIVEKSTDPIIQQLRAPEHQYVFQWQYQSTDHTVWEEIPGALPGPIDPTTTDEDGTGVGAGAGAGVGAGGGPQQALEIIRRKIWYSQPPGWMTDETIELLARVDAEHERGEAAKKATQSRGNTYVPRRRGERRPDDDTVLPNLRGSHSKIYIPRCMVRAEWLATAKGGRSRSC
ncbi:hypothetical protein C8T65DRAFT_762951 [Cerioporus squamosus]|nr:hypothetical protein C8T65DRAFT_762951 [Cerioporus squamosus]